MQPEATLGFKRTHCVASGTLLELRVSQTSKRRAFCRMHVWLRRRVAGGPDSGAAKPCHALRPPGCRSRAAKHAVRPGRVGTRLSGVGDGVGGPCLHPCPVHSPTPLIKLMLFGLLCGLAESAPGSFELVTVRPARLHMGDLSNARSSSEELSAEPAPVLTHSPLYSSLRGFTCKLCSHAV